MLSSIVTVHKTQHKHSHTCRATATTTQIERTLFKQNRSIFSVNYSLLANRSSHRLSLVERGVEDRIVCIGFLTLQSYYIYLQGKITLQLKVYETFWFYSAQKHLTLLLVSRNHTWDKGKIGLGNFFCQKSLFQP